MRFVTSLSILAVAASLAAPRAEAQTAINLIALQGLAPFSTLGNSNAGKAALAANLAVTGRFKPAQLTSRAATPSRAAGAGPAGRLHHRR